MGELDFDATGELLVSSISVSYGRPTPAASNRIDRTLHIIEQILKHTHRD
jgi:hypothetical protein